jgi:hypothetical protein
VDTIRVRGISSSPATTPRASPSVAPECMYDRAAGGRTPPPRPPPPDRTCRPCSARQLRRIGRPMPVTISNHHGPASYRSVPSDMRHVRYCHHPTAAISHVVVPT